MKHEQDDSFRPISRQGQIRAGLVARAGALALLVLGATLSAGSAFGAPLVRLPNKVCKTSTRVFAAVSVVNPGSGITSMDFTFTYNPSVLAPRKAYRTPLTTQYALTYNLSTPGTATVHLTGGPALTGPGDLVWVYFDAIGATGTSSPLTWTSSSLNAGAIAHTTQNGSVSVVTPQTLISAPATQAEPSAMVPVLISAGPFTGGDSFDIDLEFDPGVVTAVSVEKTMFTQPLTLTYNVSTPGIVRIALFGVQSLNGPGDLVKVNFQVMGPLGSETPIEITRANIREGEIPTTLAPGLFTVCHTADGDADTYSGCAGDCNDANPAIHPGAVELCNGLDDNCDGSVDNAPAALPALTVSPQPPSARVSWPSLSGASSYDVVRGGLGLLRSSGGNFTTATQACVANNLAATMVLDATPVSAGSGIWFLVRGVNCAGSGTYNTGASSQVGSRDAEIQASGFACP